MRVANASSLSSSLDLRLTEDEQSQLAHHLNLSFNSNGLTKEDVYARFHTLRDALNEWYVAYCACSQCLHTNGNVTIQPYQRILLRWDCHQRRPNVHSQPPGGLNNLPLPPTLSHRIKYFDFRRLRHMLDTLPYIHLA